VLNDEIPLSRPDITTREEELVLAVLRSGRLALGPMQDRFEEMVGERTRRRHAVACSSGTAGLHMALAALGVGPGDEVITTPFSFVAPANSILMVGATPVFVDICPKSLNADPVAVEAAITDRTKAILAVENFGNPQHMSAYRRLADKHEIKLIEDACEGLGGAHKGKPVGGFGHVAIFGFYPNKQITTGEGGMVVTDDDRVADTLRSLRNQGRAITPPPKPTQAEPGAHPESSVAGLGSWMRFERLGYNYRLSEVQAALGVAQMERLDEILERRAEVASWYMNRLLGNSEVILPSVDDDTSMSWFVFVLRLADTYTAEERDRVIAGMHRHDVGAAAYFPCVHPMPQFRGVARMPTAGLPIAESVSHRTLALPFHTRLNERDAEFAAATFELMLERENIRRR
jgi:perosamine synthetase